MTIEILKCNAEAPVSVAILDMNGLKAINDQYGHDAGDKVIKSYLLALGIVLQARGEAYRGDGGDEVFVVIPTLRFSKAIEIARNILRQINKEWLVEWPDVITGIHGDDPVQLYRELCKVVEDVIHHFEHEGRMLPPARTRSMQEVL